MMKVNLSNNSVLEVQSGISLQDLAKNISNSLSREATAGIVNGDVKDLRFEVRQEGSGVQILTFNNDFEGKKAYWHTASHILAHAVKRIFPTAKLGTDYAIANGFYYDFDVLKPFSEEDKVKIEDEMRKIIKENYLIERFTLSKDEALRLMDERGEWYKTKLIEQLNDYQSISFYKQGDFIDLCEGPHLMSTGKVKTVKLLTLSSAYWEGDENNNMLQRIYGIAFPKADALQEYLNMLDEAKKRDHRRIGRELDLFRFHETAPGMAYWLPNGWVLYNNLMDFWRSEHRKNGYQEFSAPQINNSELWKTSGHWDHYKDDMYVLKDADGNEQAIKPMSCPNAILMYKMNKRSYRELPLRFNDVDVIHRNEKSGQLNGLFRVRMFRQDDSHNFIMESQVGSEIGHILGMANEFYGKFGLEFVPSLSTRPKDFMGDVDVWNKAESQLKDVLNQLYGEGNYLINEGDGAFYGPKIDIQMKDCLGREWQMGTIQLDFQLPIKFDLEYVNSENVTERPIIVHRALFGSFERFIGVITEHFAGDFPLWVTPIQVQIIPVSDSHLEYGKYVMTQLQKEGIRVQIDERNEKIGYKIREAQLRKIPYMLIIGDKEVSKNTVGVRERGKGDLGEFPFEEFISLIKCEVQSLISEKGL